jgi:hypothetical protein
MPHELPTYTTRVEVHPNGQVFVNDVLCAQVTIGKIVDGGGAAIIPRDDLARELKLHRIADHVLRTLNDLILFLDRDDLASGVVDAGYKVKGAKVTKADYSDFGIGLVSALTGEPLTMGSMQREAGTRAGRTLRAMRGHLAKELEANQTEAATP